MKKVRVLILFGCMMLFGLLSFSNSNTYKCQLIMKTYAGEGAYVIISLINPEGQYEQTLNICGNDEDWFNEISSWWDFYGKRRNNIDGISGETISGGEQKVILFTIDNSKLNAGYKIRFETAVEDQEYYEKDVEIDLDDHNFKKSISGSGFIKSVRVLPKL